MYEISEISLGYVWFLENLGENARERKWKGKKRKNEGR